MAKAQTCALAGAWMAAAAACEVWACGVSCSASAVVMRCRMHQWRGAAVESAGVCLQCPRHSVTNDACIWCTPHVKLCPCKAQLRINPILWGILKACAVSSCCEKRVSYTRAMVPKPHPSIVGRTLLQAGSHRHSSRMLPMQSPLLSVQTPYALRTQPLQLLPNRGLACNPAA
jgi:hypothetical protein